MTRENHGTCLRNLNDSSGNEQEEEEMKEEFRDNWYSGGKWSKDILNNKIQKKR